MSRLAEVAFVSSNRWDVMGATAFGFRCVWVNRANMPDEYPEFAPAKVVRELSALRSPGERQRNPGPSRPFPAFAALKPATQAL